MAGKLKRVISQQASILESQQGTTSAFANTKFLKGLHMQMSYNRHFCTSNFTGVLSLDYPVLVEVTQGYSAPSLQTVLSSPSA